MDTFELLQQITGWSDKRIENMRIAAELENVNDIQDR